MTAHGAGDGVSWDEAAPDINQPHGLDYKELQHIKKAVRKRNDKEHEGYADATVGGEHIPGGCAVLGIDDATADMTAKAADGTGYIGRGIIYDQTNNALWCFTGDGTVADNPYQLTWGASSICKGDDFTWTGGQEFDGSVDFTATVFFDDSVDMKDVLVFTDQWLTESAPVAADIDRNGIVDFRDYARLVQSWLQQVP